MKIPCAVIKDVLPLYAEGLTGDETRALVEEHLAECADCSGEYEKMKKDSASPAIGEAADDRASEKKFIKNVKKKLGVRTVLYITAAALATALLGCLGVLLFASRPVETRLDPGTSEMYSEEDINRAFDAVVEDFKSLEGCKLYALSYAGDDSSKKEASYRRREYPKEKYAEYIDVNSEFRSPLFDRQGAWNTNTIYTGHWILGREEGGDWVVLDKGYC